MSVIWELCERASDTHFRLILVGPAFTFYTGPNAPEHVLSWNKGNQALDDMNGGATITNLNARIGSCSWMTLVPPVYISIIPPIYHPMYKGCPDRSR